jgi:hypothetical protein
MYYSFKDFKLTGFKKSGRQGKKYDAVLENKHTGKEKRVPFGALGMEQYEDLTPLGLYKNYNHYDDERRRRFIKRMKGFVRKGFYSPAWFSIKFLW